MQFLAGVFAVVLLLLAIFLIVLILIQRGKGGGLAGAFGGMGGQSAFGTKAGEKITWITIYVAAAWIILCVLSVPVLSRSAKRFSLGEGEQTSSAPASTDEQTQAEAPESGGSGEGEAPASK